MNETHTAPPLIHLSDLVSEFVSDTNAAAAAKASGRPRGIITGLSKLDNFFGGYLAPGIHVLQAAPGAGKTAFAMQTASDCAYSALFVSAEMGTLELFRRLIARQTKTFLGRLKTGEISGNQAAALAVQTAQSLEHLKIMDATKQYASPTHIIETAKRFRDAVQTDHVLIVIDSLHVWARAAKQSSPDLEQADEYSLINHAIGSVNGIAAALKCPVITIAHKNREGNKSKSGDNLHAAKGSGAIEYEAESILDLSKETETENANGEIEVRAKLQKNRNGVAGASVKLAFNTALMSFREL
jgi:replicative DNA helicase